MPKRSTAVQSRINSAWFKDRLKERELSMRGAAKRMTMDPGALSRTLSGARAMTLEEAGQLAILLNQPLQQVLTQAGLDWREVAHQATDTVKVAGRVDATHTLSRAAVGQVPRPPGLTQELEALVYQTEQTRLSHLDGWILFVEPYAGRGVQREALGHLSLVQLEDGREVVGFVNRSVEPGRYRVSDYEGLLLPSTPLRQASPIRWIQL